MSEHTFLFPAFVCIFHKQNAFAYFWSLFILKLLIEHPLCAGHCEVWGDIDTTSFPSVSTHTRKGSDKEITAMCDRSMPGVSDVLQSHGRGAQGDDQEYDNRVLKDKLDVENISKRWDYTCKDRGARKKLCSERGRVLGKERYDGQGH